MSANPSLPPALDLSGRVALVTGASRGIGRACAQLLAERGAAVAINYAARADAAETVAEMITAAGGRAITIGFDVSDPSAVDAGIKRVSAEFGGLDILVNNAGISIDALLLRASPDDLARLLAINVQGMFHCAKAAARHLLKAKERGRIINLTSVVGESGNAGQSMYAATKAAAIGLTKSLALELSSRGVTVNAVSPGYIETDMTAAAIDSAARAALLAKVPLGRIGAPDDIAQAVAWLAAPAAAYVTGQVIRVNGGMLM